MIGYIILFIGIALIFVSVCSKRNNFMEFGTMIKNHLSLFTNCKYQYVIFYIYPIFISVGLCFIGDPSISFFEQLNVVMSILISAVLAIMGILTSRNLSIENSEALKRANNVIRETNNAIVFVVFLSVILMILSTAIVAIYPIDNASIRVILYAIVYYIFTVILLNILLVVKRLRKIIEV